MLLIASYENANHYWKEMERFEVCGNTVWTNGNLCPNGLGPLKRREMFQEMTGPHFVYL